MSEIRLKHKIEVSDSIKRIHQIFKNNGFKLYLVGGAVRDTLTNRRPKDFDLATDATPNKVKELLNEYQTIESGEQFAVVNVVTPDDTYEIVAFREDFGKGRRPDEVKFSTIEKDVRRRDLTMNALFYDLDTNEIVDLVGGIEDIKNGVVKTVGKAEDRFDEDKLRIIRALRFAARVGSDIDEDIKNAIKKDKSIISGDGKPLAQERIHDEFVKGIKQARSPKHFIELMKEHEILPWVFHNLNTDGNVVNSKIPSVSVASLLKDETNQNLIKILVGELKFTKIMTKQIVFLIDFLRNGSPDTAFKFKERVEGVRLDGSVISQFGTMNGMDKRFVKTFNKYQITTEGSDLAKQGFRGKELGVEKERLETEKFKQMMGISTISYSAVVLDDNSHNQLITLLHTMFQGLEEWEEYAHHMTITLGPLPLEQKNLIGQQIDLSVTHVGYTQHVIGVKVESPIDTTNKTPHITLAVNTRGGGKPKMTNDITSWDSLLTLGEKPFIVSGVVQEIPLEQ